MPGEYCVVIGAGGLGHIGIQCLKAMCASEVIVVDISDTSLELAKQSGADHIVKADGSEVDAVLNLTGEVGVEAVIDKKSVKISVTQFICHRLCRWHMN